MRISFKQTALILVLSVFVLIGHTTTVFANSPPPPMIAVIVRNAPEDLKLSIGSETARRTDRVFESYFTFPTGLTGVSFDTLTVATDEGSYDITLPQLKRYNNIFTLDLAKRTLAPGTSRLRPLWFATITVVLTLLIEGLIFFLFGYRKRKSWAAFLVTNIITQGILYLWIIAESYPLVDFYNFPVILTLTVGEILVFITEIIVFLSLVKERHRLITFIYVLMANAASLVAGYFLVSAMI